MKVILVWDPRFPALKPSRLMLDDRLASACVRAGVAAAADPAEQADLAAGAPLDPGSLGDAIVQHGSAKRPVRIVLPASVIAVGVSLGIAAPAGGAPIPGDTAPIFTVAPSIAPASGTSSTTFTATDGAVSNGTVTGRRWLLNGTAIGTGTTVVPGATGTLVLENTATGPGGTTTSTSTAVTVSAVPAPSFTAAPSISPTSGDSATTFTATDGTVSNGSVTSRRWLLSGTALGTGTTIVPGAAGSLVLENTATGPGGTATATSSAVTVSAAPSGPAAAFTMTQLTAKRVYQRSTASGGGQGKGQGVIPVSINVTGAGSLYARIRAADGSTILQGAWRLADVATGAQTVNLASVDARLGWFYVDLSGDGASWTNGTSLVGMGRVVAISGQSLVTRMFAKQTGQSDTITSLGITTSPNGIIYATYYEADRSFLTPAWDSPVTGGNYDSCFAAEFLRLQVAAAGVNCAIAGHARGASSITLFVPGGSENPLLRSVLDAIGGFEAFIWFQGHSDTGGTYATYATNLGLLLADVTAHNALLGSNYERYFCSIPNISSTSYGPLANRQTIRRASSDFAAANGGVYVDMRDLPLTTDGIHPNAVGMVAMARHFYRAMRPSLGLPHSDLGVTITGASRAPGSTDIVLALAFPAGATALTAIGSPATRFNVFNAANTTTPLALDASTPITVGSSSITLRLAAQPADEQELDLYFAPSTDPVADGSASMIYDNNVDADGLTTGRQLVANILPVPVKSVQLGPNLTAVAAAAYQAGRSGFGQELAGGYAQAASASGIDALPVGTTWTVEAVFSTPKPTATKMAVAISGRFYLGIASDGRLVASYQGTSGALFFNGGSLTSGGTNPVISDGARHHVAIVVTPSGANLFVDGVLVGTNASAPATGAGNAAFTIASFNAANTYQWQGTVDEVAIWNRSARYTAAFTPPAAPYTGLEPGLTALYHLDGDLNAARRSS